MRARGDEQAKKKKNPFGFLSDGAIPVPARFDVKVQARCLILVVVDGGDDST